jgi:hypothetical protein
VTELHHIRTVPVELELSEGQLFGRLVPYGVVAQVADLTPSGDLDIYDEGFRKGAFARQAASTEPGVLRRVALRYEHDNPLREGVLISLEERDDGAYGEFMILPSYRNNWRALYDAGINELSVEFRERKEIGTSIEDDVRWRVDAQLVGTALVAQGAYGAVGAEVLSMRSLDEILAEQRAEREAAKERAAAEAEAAAAEVAAAEAAAAEEAAAEERRRALAEVEAFLAEARGRQAELAERYSA